MTAHNKQQAVIYCRISDKGQTGLGSQEYRCRQYADAKDYEVAEVFQDKVSGGGDFMKREAMVKLLKFLDDNRQTRFVVIFDDLKRFARDTEFHLNLRRQMMERGATRECLNFNFEDSPEGKFNEIINAAAGELDRETNARQNRQKKIARLEEGYAVYSRPPVGYKFVKAKGTNNKVLVRDEPLASIVAEAMEGFASGRFNSQAEVGRFLESQPQFPKHGPSGIVRPKRISDMLTQPIYAGFIGSKELGISLREAKHEGLISKATFEKIKDRLAGRSYAPARKDLHKGFPLRGAVACSSCGNNLRASSSKGKYKYYAYYSCHTKGCEHYGKSIARAKIEGEFETVLQGVQPSRNLIKTMMAMLLAYRDMKLSRVKEHAEAIKAEIKKTEEEIGRLVNRLVMLTNEGALAAIENKIAELELRKAVLAEKSANSTLPQPSIKESIELSLRFFASPYKIWTSGSFDLKRLVLRMVFPEPLSYDRFEGYRTPKTSIVFSALGQKNGRFLPILRDGAAREN